MNFFEKAGILISETIEFVVDKNRQMAQLNRLDAVIRNETEALNRAYVALGKHYKRMLDGEAESEDVQQICESIKVSKLRLTKARARYEYVLRYGVPEEVVPFSVHRQPEGEGEPAASKAGSTDDEDDITIAYADPSAKAADDDKQVQPEAGSDSAEDVPAAADADVQPDAAEQPAEADDVTVESIETAADRHSKKHGRKKN